MNPKIILAAALLALISAFFLFDLQDYFSLQSLKQQKDALNTLFRENPVSISALFFFGYVIITALALPAAAILTLAAGAVFGFWHGLILVSFASTIGATVAFLLTRYLFHDSVEKKFGARLEKINKGIEKEGAFYVFGLRLVPLFPFFVINSVLALTKLKTVTFYWSSQLGMLAGTAVYVNAGTQLADISSTSDILSAKLLLSFALLGVFPIIAKQALKWLKKDRNSTA
ncbi:MAG: TVP38/TMEM64 family protein [Gammaproteobacteria bacterium]|nr:TVP38/TMEM64 family protein [Gammaproteobacteria bacterium]